jgi:hypothetical protein
MEQEEVIKMQVQQMSPGIGIGMIIFWVVFYLFVAYCLARLAKKFGMPMGKAFIWAVIPIANVFLLLKLAAKPMWWFILLLIPIVNIVISIMVWMSICEKLGKPGWWGIIIGLVPIVNIIFFLILVFGKGEAAPATA